MYAKKVCHKLSSQGVQTHKMIITYTNIKKYNGSNYFKIDSPHYVLSELGGDCLGIGSERLIHHEECRRASASLGYQFSHIENEANSPRDCYFCSGDGCKNVTNKVIWNNHNTGKRNRAAQEICTRKSKSNIV